MSKQQRPTNTPRGANKIDILISIGMQTVREIRGVSHEEEKNSGNCCMPFDITLFPLILKVTFEVHSFPELFERDIS